MSEKSFKIEKNDFCDKKESFKDKGTMSDLSLNKSRRRPAPEVEGTKLERLSYHVSSRIGKFFYKWVN